MFVIDVLPDVFVANNGNHKLNNVYNGSQCHPKFHHRRDQVDQYRILRSLINNMDNAGCFHQDTIRPSYSSFSTNRIVLIQRYSRICRNIGGLEDFRRGMKVYEYMSPQPSRFHARLKDMFFHNLVFHQLWLMWYP